MRYTEMNGADAERLASCQGRAVQDDGRLSGIQRHDVDISEADPLGKSGSKGLDAGLLGSKTSGYVGYGSRRQVAPLVRGKDFFQEAVAESVDARGDPVDFHDIGANSYDQEHPVCRGESPRRIHCFEAYENFYDMGCREVKVNP
jgi:hypothetical protein